MSAPTLTSMPAELMTMIAGYLGDTQDLESFRGTCRTLQETAAMFLFDTCVLDFSENTGSNIYNGPLGHNPNWHHILGRFRQAYPTVPGVNRNWTQQQFRAHYARMAAPRVPNAFQPCQRVDHLIQNPDSYVSLRRSCRKLIIKIDNLNNATFPTFVSNGTYRVLLYLLPYLRNVELEINILCADDLALRRLVALAGNATRLHPGHRLTVRFYGSWQFFRVLNPPTAPALRSLRECRNVTVLETHDWTSQMWNRCLSSAMMNSRQTLEKLVVDSGPIHPYRLDHAVTLLWPGRGITMDVQFRDLEFKDNLMLPAFPLNPAVIRAYQKLGPNCRTATDANGNTINLP